MHTLSISYGLLKSGGLPYLGTDNTVRSDDDGNQESTDKDSETRFPPCQAESDERGDRRPCTGVDQVGYPVWSDISSA